MPRLVQLRLLAVCAMALTLLFATAALAMAKAPVASLRVVGAGGKLLDEDSFRLTPVSIKASPRATCFGAGTGGSGKTVSVKSPSALSMLVQASKSTPALRPLQLTDAFSFGSGLCNVGRSKATRKLSWYLKVNHVEPAVGGESVKVHAGDEVLWALEPYPYPEELSLVAPPVVSAGEPFEVQVFGYNQKGKRKPVAGAVVTGAEAPTGSDGRATVVLQKAQTLFARHGEDIPSNGAFVCAGGAGALC
ncbi:MAG TPA: hypothetical protein VFN89_06160 [Solirubrobacterales bacterium]|nr:hypothetical protein [Solirubrobacterales bacterium]